MDFQLSRRLLPEVLHAKNDSACGVADERAAQCAGSPGTVDPGAPVVGAFFDRVRVGRELHELVRIPHRHVAHQFVARQLVEIGKRLAGKLLIV